MQKQKKRILETWMQNQLAESALRDDFTTNDELLKQYEELLNALARAIKSGNVNNIYTTEFNQITDILGDISLTCARQGFSPRETGMYVLSLKKAIIEVLEEEYKSPSNGRGSRFLFTWTADDLVKEDEE